MPTGILGVLGHVYKGTMRLCAVAAWGPSQHGDRARHGRLADAAKVSELLDARSFALADVKECNDDGKRDVRLSSPNSRQTRQKR